MKVGVALLILAAAWGLQSLLAWRQMSAFRRRLGSLMKVPGAGYVGIGVAGGGIRPGVVVVLATDVLGTIIRSECMRGLSVFAGLREFPELIGTDVHSLQNLASSTRYRKHLRTAIEKAAAQVIDRMARDQAAHPFGQRQWLGDE